MAPSDPAADDDVPSRFHVDFTGKTLGAYRVEKRIAEGAMGGVYLAEDTNLGMRVVVKVPHARFLGEAGFRARFRREIAELVRLEHPHVVRILARGEEEEVPYFVLQYLGGGSLEAVLEKGRQALPAALAWLAPIATTLDFVHERGVVHRDVKPGNILFDEQGHVFLSDFGLVKALDRREEGKLTEAGTGIGSPLYMAPEQGIGGEVTGAADQYALASTLYEALAGQPPFGGGTVLETMVRKQRDPAPGVRDLAPQVPPAGEAAIRRALDRDPAARFPSCAAFAEEVARSLPGAQGPPPSRARAAALLLAGLLAAALGVGALTGWYGLASGRGAVPAVDPVGSSIVVLAKAGSEPRVAHRFRPIAGSTDRFFFHATDETRMPEEPVQTSLREQEVSLRVVRVERDGRFGVEWTLHAPRAGRQEGIPDEQVASEQKTYDTIGVLGAAATVTPQGDILDLRLVGMEKVPPEATIDALQYEEALRAIEVVFPAEPIGVGAVWDVTKAGTFMGVRFQMTRTFELLSAEGSRLRVGFVERIGAPPQDWHLPGTPEGTTVKLLSMKVASEGTVLLDVSRPAPLEWKMTREVDDLLIEMPAPSSERMSLGGTYEMRLRRE